jgi:hypothetical protein
MRSYGDVSGVSEAVRSGTSSVSVMLNDLGQGYGLL